MFFFHPEDGRIRGVSDCPACKAPVVMVVSPDDRVRWCCLTCRTFGTAPFDYQPDRYVVWKDETDEQGAALLS